MGTQQMTHGKAPQPPPFKTIRLISREAIPPKMYAGRKSALRELLVVKEFEALLKHVQSSGANPQEIVGELDLTAPDVKKAASKLKSFKSVFRVYLTSTIKRHGLEKELDILERNNGQNFYVVGRSVSSS